MVVLPMLGGEYCAAGGPYLSKPVGFRGVKLASEIPAESDLELGCEDFSTPDPAETISVAREALRLLANGESVYCGCMGGIGRTGTFLAVLAKACGIRKPVDYIRNTYYAYAVETPAQEEFIAGLNVRSLRWSLRWWRLCRWLDPGWEV